MKEQGNYLGIELGSTRIKAVLIDREHRTLSTGDHTWASSFEDGIWTYPLEDAWAGLKAALGAVENRQSVRAMGISAMMHGYLAFDKDWNLLVPFRTWQNTMTAAAAAELTQLFGFNIPQRWSIAHLYQAILNGEAHVKDVAHITTLAGYIHFRLTGVNAVGVGEASGMFPIGEGERGFDERMLDQFDALLAARGLPWRVREVLPQVMMAGQCAGHLTAQGAALLDGLLEEGIAFAPPEGDVGTGMTATNAVAARTGNISAGTSIFAMIVLEKPLSKVYPEIDIVATPAGKPAAMVHCNNCTNDMNAWAGMLREVAQLFGGEASTGELFTKLYQKSLEGDPDCDGVLVYNYMAGEGITHLDSGRPLVARRPDSRFTLANFMRAQLYATMATLRLGMDMLADENVAIDSLTGHGGLFKTPGVGQRYMAAACKAPVTCLSTASEGGPYGMALLAAYMDAKADGETLEDYLDKKVFGDGAGKTVLAPLEEDVRGFDAYMRRYQDGLAAQQTLVRAL